MAKIMAFGLALLPLLVCILAGYYYGCHEKVKSMKDQAQVRKVNTQKSESEKKVEMSNTLK